MIITEFVSRSKRRPLAAARLRIGLAVLAISLSSASSGTGQANDLVDTASLGERGAVLESVGSGFLALQDAQGIGDFNGDGLDDVVLGVRETELLSDEPYAVVLAYGRPNLTQRQPLDHNFPGTAIFRVEAPELTEWGGVLITPTGDLNDDGLADFLFGFSSYRRDPGSGEGTAFLVYGAPGLVGDGFVEEVGGDVPGTVFLSSDPSFGLFDQDHAGIGDLNGDGDPDFAIGCYSSVVGNGANAGVVFVLLEASRLPPVVDLTDIRSASAVLEVHGKSNEGLGKGIAPAGDLNGDGFDDFLVMARREIFSGIVYLVYGRADPPAFIDLQQDTEVQGVVTFHKPSGLVSFGGRGQAVGVGDVNDDGFDDVLISAADTEGTPPGGDPKTSIAYLFYGSPEFPSRVGFDDVPPGLGVAIRPQESGFAGDAFGDYLASVGDVNGDAVPDFLIGAYKISVRGKALAGEAYVVFGKRDLGTDLSLGDDFDGIRMLGETAHGGLGSIVAPAGDFNGDGAPDILAGASNFAVLDGKGRAYLVYGTGSDSPPFTVLGLEPTSGTIRGGTTVVVRGSGFQEAPLVLFGGRRASSVTVVSGSELRAMTPPADRPGWVDVAVTVGGETKSLPAAFEYIPNLPEINLEHLGDRGLRLDGESGKGLGVSLAFGDVNGDGVDDLLVGSTQEGDWIVSLVHGQSGLPEVLPAFVPSPQVTLIGTSAASDSSPVSVAVLGDVNDDRISDLGIAPWGAVGYILFGRPDFPDEVDVASEVVAGRAVLLERGNFERNFSLVPVRDLTGDGIADFAVGFSEAPLSTDDPLPEAGEILFVEGRPDWPEIVDLSDSSAFFSRIHGIRAEHSLARQLALVGDTDGDGFPDLLANSFPFPDRARSYLLYLDPDLPAEIDVETYAQQKGVIVDRVDRQASFTSFINVARAGDVNDDGFADFLVGDETGGELNQGVVFLVQGGPGLPAFLDLDDTPDDPDDHGGIVRLFGAAHRVQAAEVGPAGDFSGDGFDDFLIGGQNSSPMSPGNVSVLFGGDALPDTIDLRHLGAHGFRLDGLEESTRLETPAPESGDINGDGYPDFAFSEVGSPGAVYVIYGLPPSIPFIRGDATFEGLLNISDAIFTLSFLFLGTEAPRCEDAADTDDDGILLLTDAIYLLTNLFLGGPAPPPPYPDPGVDPSDDSLECRGF